MASVALTVTGQDPGAICQCCTCMTKQRYILLMHALVCHMRVPKPGKPPECVLLQLEHDEAQIDTSYSALSSTVSGCLASNQADRSQGSVEEPSIALLLFSNEAFELDAHSILLKGCV